jgi:hypothetical protein
MLVKIYTWWSMNKEQRIELCYLNILQSKIKWVASFISSLLLKNYLQRLQTLQLFLIGNYLQK